MSTYTCEDKIKLSKFIKYIDDELYVEICVRSTKVKNSIYQGTVKNFINNKEKYEEYFEMSLEYEGITIDSSGILYILIDSE